MLLPSINHSEKNYPVAGVAAAADDDDVDDDDRLLLCIFMLFWKLEWDYSIILPIIIVLNCFLTECQPGGVVFCLKGRESCSMYVYINMFCVIFSFEFGALLFAQIIWYQVFLSNTNNSYTIIWFQATNNSNNYNNINP